MSKEIPLTKGKVTLVDDEDYEWLMQWKWRHDRGYAERRIRYKGGRKVCRMHREILQAPSGMEVDHIDGNGLDNRRCNLRLATPQQNRVNKSKPRGRGSSQYKGVHWCKPREIWVAGIQAYNSKSIYLGSFIVEEDAARAYDAAARYYFGEFARTNFPEETR